MMVGVFPGPLAPSTANGVVRWCFGGAELGVVGDYVDVVEHGVERSVKISLEQGRLGHRTIRPDVRCGSLVMQAYP